MTRERPDDRTWVMDALGRFERPLLAYTTRLLSGDVERARDVVQDVFLRLCQQQRAAIAPRLAEWLFTVSRNAALDARRKERKMETIEHDTVPRSAIDADPAFTAEKNDEVSRVLRALASLPEGQREVLQLRFQHGLSYGELSGVTGRSLSSVGVLLHVGIKSLRAKLGITLGQRLAEGTLR